MEKLTDEHGTKLLKLAHAAIKKRLKGKKVEISQFAEPLFQEKRGTFVTLKIKNQLRGCIGNIEPVKSIVEGINDNAENAAFNDHRFSPLSLEEFDSIQISISILTEAVALSHKGGRDLVAKLRPHKDGVILRKGGAGATFLPQVWQQLPDAAQFLSHLCQKAGLRKDCWIEDDVKILTYQVQSFEEGGR